MNWNNGGKYLGTEIELHKKARWIKTENIHFFFYKKKTENWEFHIKYKKNFYSGGQQQLYETVQLSLYVFNKSTY